MNTFYFFIISTFIWVSCASSQTMIAQQQATEKVKKMARLIELTEEQEKKMLEIEAIFLEGSRKLKYSPSYHAELKTLSDTRVNKIKEILTRSQFLKFDLIENNKIKLGPVRAGE